MMPGSREAKENGCTCPKEQPMAYQGIYWYGSNCALHPLKSKTVAFPDASKTRQIGLEPGVKG